MTGKEHDSAIWGVLDFMTIMHYNANFKCGSKTTKMERTSFTIQLRSLQSRIVLHRTLHDCTQRSWFIPLPSLITLLDGDIAIPYLLRRVLTDTVTNPMDEFGISETPAYLEVHLVLEFKLEHEAT